MNLSITNMTKLPHLGSGIQKYLKNLPKNALIVLLNDTDYMMKMQSGQFQAQGTMKFQQRKTEKTFLVANAVKCQRRYTEKGIS